MVVIQYPPPPKFDTFFRKWHKEIGFTFSFCVIVIVPYELPPLTQNFRHLLKVLHCDIFMFIIKTLLLRIRKPKGIHLTDNIIHRVSSEWLIYIYMCLSDLFAHLYVFKCIYLFIPSFLLFFLFLLAFLSIWISYVNLWPWLKKNTLKDTNDSCPRFTKFSCASQWEV